MERDPHDPTAPAVSDAPASKEPYEPPAVVSEEVFETLALHCGKVHGNRCQRSGGLQS